MTAPYNPLDIDNIAVSIANALLATAPSPLANISERRFNGAGIYAIYYVGGFEPYRLVAEANRGEKWEQPLYVGKAIPSGARKGVRVATDTVALWERLKDHRGSVLAATNLDIEDFFCRWLVIEPIWIPLGESLLINRYAPVWNALIDGFGNHDPGKGRHQGMRTRWDVLHPGRGWSVYLQHRPETVDTIAADAAEYIRARSTP